MDKKKLKLSSKSKFIAGVCAGIAEYFNIDSTIVRIIFILLAIIFEIAPIVIIYIICWAVMPSSD